MLTTPATIDDGALLALLGELLRSDIDPAATGAMRLRLMQPGFSWQALVDLARGQDVVLPLVFALEARALLPPVPRSSGNSENHVTTKLRRDYAHHLAWRRADTAQLARILQVLDAAAIVPLILKGARYLVDPLAPWCEARSMSDFDILVHPADAPRAVAALQAEGYRASLGDLPKISRHLPALAHPDHALALEIHVTSLSRAGEGIMSTEQVWARATRTSHGGFLVLPACWHALHGLLHHQIQDGGHQRRTLCVKGLWEFAMLARAFTPDDWEAMRAQMRAAGASDVFESWLLQAHRLFGLDAPFLAQSSAAAQSHAAATFRRASRPYVARRAGDIFHQFRYSFARETLADKYDIAPSRVSLVHAGRNIADLLRRHRGGILQRLSGPPG